MSVLEKVKGLVELAARSEQIEEARNAALKACRLIKLHGLEIAERVVEEVSNDPNDYEPASPEQSGRKRRPVNVEKLGRVVSRGAGRVAGEVVTDFLDGVLRGRGGPR